MLTVGSLFSGIGGFDLGLERSGMRVIWQSEIDPYASAVLEKHWPRVPNLGDIRTITGDRLVRRSAWNDWVSGRDFFPDVLCGGFPCQDISNAGKRAGINGERSGLWGEYARVIGELRPRYVIVENVSALLGRGLERVLGDLAALGFDAEWHCIPASAVGAPHRRDRIWIVAYANERGRPTWHGDISTMGHGHSAAASGSDVADANVPRLALGELLARVPSAAGRGDAREDAPVDGENQGAAWDCRPGNQGTAWEFEPDVGRVAHGVPSRVDRLRCLGNAVVSQIPEIIGKAIIEWDSANTRAHA